MTMVPRTLFDKIWEDHVVRAEADGTTLLYIDRHLVHEVTSPQAFEGLTVAGRAPRRPAAALAVPDHNVPTTDRSLPVADPVSAKQIQTLQDNCATFGITFFGMNDIRQGVVHIIGPEQGFAHLDSRRLWRAGIWHRNQRSGARAGDAMFSSEAP
jgi:3-isopropylmalate/(R)-2-methylmalate dehydratase large subunit